MQKTTSVVINYIKYRYLHYVLKYFRWINYIWSFHMAPEHEALHTAAECQAGLQVC